MLTCRRAVGGLTETAPASATLLYTPMLPLTLQKVVRPRPERPIGLRRLWHLPNLVLLLTGPSLGKNCPQTTQNQKPIPIP
jgi:hypothetical protein